MFSYSYVFKVALYKSNICFSNTNLILKFNFEDSIYNLYFESRAIVKNNGTNSRDHQPIKDFIVFLRVFRDKCLRVYEGFEGS